MSDNAPDAPGPMDEKALTYVQSMMKSVPEEDIKSVVEQAEGLLGSNEGRLQVAVQSGLAMGIEIAFRDLYDGYDEALRGLLTAVEKLDAFMQSRNDPELIRALAEIRNPMAQVIDSCTDSVTEEERIQEVLTNFGLPEDVCKQPTGEVGEFSMESSSLMALGLAKRWPEMFQAYVVFRNDQNLACKCPWHILGAWRDQSTEEAMRRFDEVLTRFPPGSPECKRLIQEYIQWWINSARESYRGVVTGNEDLKPPLISEAESRLVAEGIFAQLGVGGVKKS